MGLYRKFVSKKTGAAPVTGKSIKVVEAERRPHQQLISITGLPKSCSSCKSCQKMTRAVTPFTHNARRISPRQGYVMAREV